MTEYNDVQSLHIAKEERADSLLFFLLIDYYFEKLLLASQMNWTEKKFCLFRSRTLVPYKYTVLKRKENKV